MKKIILLLLFASAISYGQVKRSNQWYLSGTNIIRPLGSYTVEIDNLRDIGNDGVFTLGSTGYMTFDVVGTGNSYVEIIQDNNAGYLAVGRTSATESSVISVTDGGSDNEPGFWQMYNDGGTGYWHWTATNGEYRIANAQPADDDAGGYVIIDADDGTIGATDQPLKASTITANNTITGDIVYGQKYINADSVIAHNVASKYYAISFADATANNVTNDTDSTFTLTVAGTYLINFSISSTHVTNNTIVHASIFVDDVEQNSIEGQRKIGTGGDKGNYGSTGILTLSGSEVLKLKTKADNTGNQTISYANVNISRLN